jgi:acetyl esterase/lipase
VDGGVTRLRYGRLPSQHAELRVPPGAGPHPLAVVVHGGFWLAAYDLRLMSPVCEALTAQGVATWNVEYRRLGEDGGGWPGTFRDVAAAADRVRDLAGEYRLDMGRVVSVGHSAGGHLALWLAARRRLADPHDPLFVARPLVPRTAIALAGVPDLRAAAGFDAVRRLMGGTPDEVPARYASGSPAELLPLGVRQILVHGTADSLVPFAMSEAYQAAAAARGDDAVLVPFVGAGHFEPIDPASTPGAQVLALVVDAVPGVR